MATLIHTEAFNPATGDSLGKIPQNSIGDIKEAVKYFNGVVEDIAKGKIPIGKFVVTKTMTKRAELYENIQPHSELAKKIKKRSPAEAPGVGDRMRDAWTG